MTPQDRALVKTLVDRAARARALRLRDAEDACRNERFAMRREARGLPPLEYASGCVGCGVPYADRTPGCHTCNARHANYRKRPASARRGVMVA